MSAKEGIFARSHRNLVHMYMVSLQICYNAANVVLTFTVELSQNDEEHDCSIRSPAQICRDHRKRSLKTGTGAVTALET